MSVEVRGLTKRFGETRAVEDLSFQVRPGEVTGFLGPNGAGKTTTLRMLLGLARPTAGEALVLGRPYRELAWPAQSVGAVLDAGGLHPARTGRGQLGIAAHAAGVDGARVEELLELVDLTQAADRRIRTYSLGMRRRLSLACALLGDPEVLILDEPANGLDPGAMRWLRDHLRALAAEGRAVLVSSHVLAEVAQTVDRVLVIVDGQLRADETMAEVAGRGTLEDAFLQLTGEAQAPEPASRPQPAARVRAPAGPSPNGAAPAPSWTPPAGDATLGDLAAALGRWRGPSAPVLLGVAGPKGGVGRTATALLVADALASMTRLRVACVDANPRTGTLLRAAGGDCERGALPGPIDAASDPANAAAVGALAAHTASGTHVFGFAPADQPCALGATEYEALLDLLERFYDVVVCDLPPAPCDPVAALVLGRAHGTLAVLSDEPVAVELAAIGLDGLAPEAVTPVLNRHSGPVPVGVPDAWGAPIAVPDDPLLSAQLGAGRYDADALAEATRLAAARLAVAVARRAA